MDDPIIEPVGSQAEIKPTYEVVSEPSDDFVDLTNNITDSPEAESAFADAAIDTTEIPLDEPSDEFVDIFGGESEARREEVVVVADVTVEAAADKSEVTSDVTGPPDYRKTGSDDEQEAKETATDSIIDLSDDLPASETPQPPPASDTFVDPLVDFLSDAPPSADAKIPSRATVDLFEDKGNDLFTEPRQTKSAKQLQKSLFGERDEDLFGEPLGAASKKPVSRELKSKPVTTKAASDVSDTGGPLQDSDPADIFSEEAVTTVPSIKKTSTVNSKTNGVHSEEETDIFAGGSTIFY